MGATASRAAAVPAAAAAATAAAAASAGRPLSSAAQLCLDQGVARWISSTSQLCQAKASGGTSSSEDADQAASCPEGSTPRAALEAQLAKVEQRLAALYTTSDELQQQEAQLAKAEEDLLR